MCVLDACLPRDFIILSHETKAAAETLVLVPLASIYRPCVSIMLTFESLTDPPGQCRTLSIFFSQHLKCGAQQISK